VTDRSRPWLEPRLVLSLAVLLACGGVVAWITMPCQEDPRVASRWAFLTVPFPGAPVDQVERLIADPLEQALAEIEEIERLELTVREGVAVAEIELSGHVYDTDRAWDRVRRILGVPYLQLPSGAGPIELEDDVVSPESVVLALTGGRDHLERLAAARQLKRDLLFVPDIKRIRIVGDSGEEIEILADDSALRRMRLDYGVLASQLALRNEPQPVGTLAFGDRRVSVSVHGDFESIDEIEHTSVFLPSGSAVPLGSIASVRRRTREPLSRLMRLDGLPAVGLAVTPVPKIDIVRFGRTLRERVEALRSVYPHISIHEAMFQPDHVAARVAHLGTALAIGIAVVAGILLLAMGPRVGAVIAATIPLVVFTALACYAAGGGILHQLSISGLVIAVGLIVDNAIVVAENIQREIDLGQDAEVAAWRSVRDLAFPLGAATATTVAAFVPMYLARGSTADFVRALPIIVISSLVVSYLFAIAVTPVLCRMFLRPRRRSERTGLALIGSRIARFATARPRRVLLGTLVAIGLCAIGAQHVDKRFFPASGRSQVIVTLQLPEGSDLLMTDASARRFEQALLKQQHVRSVATFVGEAAPLFYYNLNRHPSSPHLAQLVVGTEDRDGVAPLITFARGFARTELPQASTAVSRLQQGLPIDAPIEIRVYGPGLRELSHAADLVLATLRKIPGTVDQYHDLGVGTPTLRFQVNDAAAGRYGLERRHLTRALLARSGGVPVGQYRGGEDPVPIVIRSPNRASAAGLTAVEIATEGGTSVPVGQIATSGIDWLPGAIHRHNRRPVTTVSSHLEDGFTSQAVLRRFRARLAASELPPRTSIEYGGEAEGSSTANRQLFQMLPFGALLLLCVLLAEFRSFRRVGIILVTVPLAAAGIVPGLLLFGQPFGFMSILGAVSLTGIVVNNAILLLDVVDRQRRAGQSVSEALVAGVALRIRPVLLTTVTTIAGLLPLALSGTELWPPMALAIISGLSASTLLTLIVVPSLYWMAFSRESA